MKLGLLLRVCLSVCHSVCLLSPLRPFRSSGGRSLRGRLYEAAR